VLIIIRRDCVIVKPPASRNEELAIQLFQGVEPVKGVNIFKGFSGACLRLFRGITARQ
jgi:hypothetical protein